jgi:thiol-disulfide isomerase/thioredoxin
MNIKNIILISCLFISVKCLGQVSPGKQFTLHGEIADTRLDSVSIEYINDQGKYIHEIIPAVNGKFSITGTISQPSFSFLLFKHKGEIISKRDAEIKRNLVYLEPGNMVINKEADQHGLVYIKGSKSQDEWNLLKGETRALEGVGGEPAIAANKAKINGIYYSFFISHPDSYVSSDRVMYFTGAFSLDSLKTIYQNFTPAVKESTGARRLAAAIKSREVGLPGTEAFQFVVKDRNAQNLALSDFKGKYILLDFWATWCVPCRKSMPDMILLYQKYKGQNFDIIAVGDDDKNVVNWSAAIDKDGTGSFHHVLRGSNIEMSRKGTPNPRDLGEQYGIRALPTKILINPDGKIIGRFDSSSEEELTEMLASIFKM